MFIGGRERLQWEQMDYLSKALHFEIHIQFQYYVTKRLFLYVKLSLDCKERSGIKETKYYCHTISIIKGGNNRQKLTIPTETIAMKTNQQKVD